MKFASIVILIFAVLFNVVRAPPPKTTENGCLKRRSYIKFQVRKRNVIDLTYVTNEASAVWPSTPFGFKVVEQFKGYVTDPFRYFVSSNEFSQPEHLGTHMDAPVHFSETGNSVDEVGFENLIGEGLLVDLTMDGERFNETLITLEHLLEWESKRVEGRIRSGSIMLLRTGYGDYYNTDRSIYWGTSVTGSEAVPLLNFPGLHPDATKWLVEKRCIGAVGIDTPSIDEGQAKGFPSHEILSASNIPIFENVGNLDKVAQRGKRFKVIALPYKMEGATGAPLRMVAVLN